MAIEKERKFLVNPEALPPEALKAGCIIESCYFTESGPAVRVTLRDIGGPREKAKFCIKSPAGLERQEFEYSIPMRDALSLRSLAPTHILKHRFDFEGWEIDRIYLPREPDLWVAEWEEAEGKAPMPEQLPKWIGMELTGDSSYSMQQLAWRHCMRRK